MAAAAITPSRLAALTRARCAIFKTAHNSTSARTGAKYFRARLRGPSMVNYYPQDIDLSMSKLAKEWPELELVNFAEAQRLWDVDMKRARGKGAPAKAKDKSQSRRTQRRR
ncbi:mitochondrial ribosomal subunit S27-domain-containing protein [Boletus edulis]|uniref:Small ribosomal subunit protein mS33 n=1 Tax=Boletus edulis BED1 TaxID=1328754 RepID=A0AAD4BQY6_BOLED|nr:mitochondrial ribosomal subunit S27-domain-containing protein [Boletus edulis]KAF8437575.1 mitochondrial ribosomal subunit S27-domain-containing protein [Boletus edulis BED1]